MFEKQHGTSVVGKETLFTESNEYGVVRCICMTTHNISTFINKQYESMDVLSFSQSEFILASSIYI